MNTIVNNSVNTNFSWSPVFGGVFTATAIGALFSLLGTAMGFALFKPNADVINMLSMSALVWFIIGGTIAMFLGGLVTGFLAPTTCLLKGMMYGIVMWSFSFILGLFLTMSGAGTVVTGSAQLIGNTISSSSKVIASTAGPMMGKLTDNLNLNENKSLQRITDQVGDLAKQAAKKATGDEQGSVEAILQSPDEAQEKLVEAIKNFVTNTDDMRTNQLRQAAVDLLTENTKLNQQQAEQALDKWQEAYENAADKAQEKMAEFSDKAKEVANDTAGVLSAVAFAALLAMLFGAVATLLGSTLGVKWQRKQNNYA